VRVLQSALYLNVRSKRRFTHSRHTATMRPGVCIWLSQYTRITCTLR